MLLASLPSAPAILVSSMTFAAHSVPSSIFVPSASAFSVLSTSPPSLDGDVNREQYDGRDGRKLGLVLPASVSPLSVLPVLCNPGGKDDASEGSLERTIDPS